MIFEPPTRAKVNGEAKVNGAHHLGDLAEAKLNAQAAAAAAAEKDIMSALVAANHRLTSLKRSRENLQRRHERAQKALSDTFTLSAKAKAVAVNSRASV